MLVGFLRDVIVESICAFLPASPNADEEIGELLVCHAVEDSVEVVVVDCTRDVSDVSVAEF